MRLASLAGAPDGGWSGTTAGYGAGSDILVSNLQDRDGPEELPTAWQEPGALADIAFAAGLLGLAAGLVAVLRLTGAQFPDGAFMRALPLLVLIPPVCFVGALMAPGGILRGGTSARSRAVWLGMSGLASYLVPLVLLVLTATLASKH
jgi:hypothetical protein